MKRLLPKTLTGQLIALLLGALVMTQLVAALVFIGERRETLRDFMQEQVMQRTAGLARLLAETPSSSHAGLLRAVNSRFLRFRLAPAPAIAANPGDPEIAALARRMRALLDTPVAEVRIVASEAEWWQRTRRGFRRGWRHAHDDDHDPGERRARRLVGMQIALALPDGRWLNAAAVPPAPPRGWRLYGLFTLGLFAALVVVIVVVTVRRIAQPMQRLAAAAEAFGRGADVGALPETGPAEVRRATQEFNRMRERIDRFVQDRTRMLAAISHDLRTPITSLRLRVEFVEDEALAARMRESLDEMQRMTEESLAFLREEATAEPTRSVDLCALVESLADDLRDLGHDVGVAECGRLVCACRPAALRRALGNLIGNAVRYGERARVSVAREGAALVVTVDDDGPGIPEETVERVFEPFVRLDESRSTETGGLGLGLAIARTIVRAHGGEITLVNRPEGGLRARMTLPA